MLFIEIDEIINDVKKNNSPNDLFQKLTNKKLKTYFNNLFDNIYEETSKIYLYFEEKINQFPKLFDNNLSNMTDTMNYLEKIAIPSNTECSDIIDDIPCWRCLDCTEYNNIYCSNCYINSKNLHKGHKIHFLPKTEGMCDCGDPNAFRLFCPNHNGRFKEQKEIDEFISKSFTADILEKLKLFFDDFFLQFSKYLILTEKCTFFCNDIFLNNITNVREIDDVYTLKDNFSIVFQNFLTFLYIITNKNMGMLYLITTYIIKNHLISGNNIEEKFKTSHTCIKLENKNIQILYENKDKNENIFSLKEDNSKDNHICECPFLRLLLTNWRDIIESIKEKQNEKLITSFFHNYSFKEMYSLLFFFNFQEIILNFNKDIIIQKEKYLSNENILLIESQSNLLEYVYNKFYEYLKQILELPKLKNDEGVFNKKILEKIQNLFIILANDSVYFIQEKTIQIINSKINILKIILDIASLMHNQYKYASIFPHPEFQGKPCSIEFINYELLLIKIASRFNMCYDWEDYDKLKDFFDYIINKILSQNTESNKQLKENEYSFHLSIYRFFGIFINHFCFNYALKNNKNLIDSIEYIKNKLFNSKEEMQKVIDLIVNDYFKMFGFITGIRNDYFNYYDSLQNYNNIYFNNILYLKIDFTLLKYLLAMSEKKFNLDSMLKISNIENVYSFFNKIFKEKKLNDKKEIDEDEKKHIMQWVKFFEIIIIILKNDSSHLYNAISYYNDIICLKTKTELFNNIKKNEKIMYDLKNNLKEKIILLFIACGNLLEKKNLKKLIDDSYLELFNDKEFDDILNDLTDTKIDNKKIIYSLKDSNLKYLDFDYFFSPFIKSKAELYVNDFKKDKFKIFNSYFFRPSMLTFDFYCKAFENILLNIENIEFILNVIEVLLCKDEQYLKYINPIKNEILPLMLNYITIIGSINSKTFIKFKLENKSLFNKISDILNNALEDNKNKEILDNDLSENVKNTIKKLNAYKIIYDNIKGDLNKLNDYDYNNDNNFIIENEKIDSIKNKEENLQNGIKSKKNKEMKEKYKNLIKQKRNKFIDKIKTDKTMTNILENGEKKNLGEEKDTIMCFFCRNIISLNSFKEPYGKIGNINKDFFYKNSFRSSIRTELNKIMNIDNEEKNKIYSNIKDNNKVEDISIRILSCGHYFHQKCFENKLNQYGDIKCPVCEKFGNVLIPPLSYFHGKEDYLKSEKLSNILDKKIEYKQVELIKDSDIFKDICISFLQSNLKKTINLKEKIKDYNQFIDELFKLYEYYIDYLNNLFYCDATTFYKQQQIDNIQNLILVLRYLIKINIIDITQIINYIRNGIDNLINGQNENDNILKNFKEMYYSKNIDKIIFFFLILLDYDEIQKLFLYVINWTMPYLGSWLYLRNIIIENNCYSFYDEKTKEKINTNILLQFLNDKSKEINNYIKLFLQKLLLLKIITKHDNKKNDIMININTLTIENLFSELNIGNIYQLLTKDSNNEINIIDILEKLPKILMVDNSYIIKNCIIIDYKYIFNLLINNLIKIKEEKYLINAEFFYQFILYKFELIELENNVFDFIEKNLFKSCCICKKNKKESMLCLICGNKMCIEEILSHVFKCTLSDIINIDLMSMKLLSFYDYKEIKLFYPLYTNEYNEGPNSTFITNEYNLNKEKIKLALRSFVSNDFH